jgi:AraC-like DNA-binding protein
MIASFLLFLALGALLLSIRSLIRTSVETDHILLAILGLSLAVYQIGSALAIGDLYFNYPHLAGIGEPFFVLLPILVYLIIKERLGKGIQVRDAIHILPFVLYFILMIPFYVLPSGQKVGAYDLLLDMDFQSISDVILPGMSVLVVAGYGFASQGIVEQWQKKIDIMSADPDLLETSTQNSLRWLIWSLLAMVIAFLMMRARLLDTLECYTVIALGFSSAYLKFIWSYLFNSQAKLTEWVPIKAINSTMNPIEWPDFQDEVDLSCTPADEGFSWQDPSKARVSLYETRQQAWHQHMEQMIKLNRWWREPELTLTQVSSRLGLSADLLHRLLLERERCSFFDYINRKRVDFIKKQLAESSHQHNDLSNLALESGFRDVKTLKRVFLYYTGTSLRTYKRLCSISDNL